MKKAVIYARVSSKEQEREGYSIPAQIELLKNYAKRHNLQIVNEFTDIETAKTSGRTKFTEMLKFLKKNKTVKIILVEKTDRLYRNFKDYTILEDLDLEVHLVKEGEIISKNSTSHAKFIHGIKMLMAKNYIDNLSEETKKGMVQKALQGEWPSKEPYGYKRVDKNTVIPDPEKAPFVKRAFEIYAAGNISLKSTCEKLKEEGYFYRPYQQKICIGSLEAILKNVFYMGKMNFKGSIYEGKHEPIISEYLFNKVQQAFRKDNKPLYRKRSFVFGNMIKCAACGCVITAEEKKGKYTYYHCTWGKGDCGQRKNVPESELEKQFEQAVKKINVTPEHKNWIIKALKEGMKDSQVYHRAEVDKLRKQADRIKERMNKLLISKLDGEISQEDWSEHNNQFKDQLEKTRNLIEAHENANNGLIDYASQTLELAQDAYNAYLAESLDEKASFLKRLLSNCVKRQLN